MNRFITRVLSLFLVVFAASALLAVVGVGYSWYATAQGKKPPELRYLGMLLTSTVMEAVGIVVFYAKQSAKYLPVVEVNKKAEETDKFLENFIVNGSSVIIVSNRLSWLQRSERLRTLFQKRSSAGVLIEIITPGRVDPSIRTPLELAGVRFFVTREGVPPEARFTLVNAHRGGAERLAIARGTYPDHEITVFDNNSGPQIICLAKDLIRKAKTLADV